MMDPKKKTSPEGTTWSGTFIFDPTDAIYMFHFPSQPVVPGSLIVHAFMEAARRVLQIRNFRLEAFRFREFVQPDGYEYSIEQAGSRLRCSLFRENRLLVTGFLIGDDGASMESAELAPLRHEARERGRL